MSSSRMAWSRKPSAVRRSQLCSSWETSLFSTTRGSALKRQLATLGTAAASCVPISPSKYRNRRANAVLTRVDWLFLHVDLGHVRVQNRHILVCLLTSDLLDRLLLGFARKCY